MPPDESCHRALVDAFANYLRRQLEVGADETVIVQEDRECDTNAAEAASIMVTTGKSTLWRTTPWRRSRSREHTGLHRQFSGTARADPRTGGGLAVTIWDRWNLRDSASPPPSFTVTAIVTTYNEADIVEQLLDRLVGEGLHVHVVDNWSTDDTLERVRVKAGAAPITVERWPADHPSRYFDLQGLLRKVEQVAHSCGADWVIHHDADQIHESPWAGTSVRDALWAIDGWGFNAIDHTGLDFRPVDDRWNPGDDLASSFEYFEFPPLPSYFTLVKGWKPQPEPVDLASNGGHEIVFGGRRVFPYKFIIRHYPIRSQEHGERKILTERKARWDPAERAKGWHVHYDHFSEGSSFLWDPADPALHRWDDLDDRFLLQRLSGAGLPGNPRPDESVTCSGE